MATHNSCIVCGKRTAHGCTECDDGHICSAKCYKTPVAAAHRQSHLVGANFPGEPEELKNGTVYEWFGIAVTRETWSLITRLRSKFKMSRGEVEKYNNQKNDAQILWCWILESLVDHINVKSPSIPLEGLQTIMSGNLRNSTSHAVWKRSEPGSSTKVSLYFVYDRFFKAWLKNTDPEWNWNVFPFDAWWSCTTARDALDWKNPKYLQTQLANSAREMLKPALEKLYSIERVSESRWKITFTETADGWQATELTRSKKFEDAPQNGSFNPVIIDKDFITQSEWVEMQFASSGEWEKKNTHRLLKDSLYRSFNQPKTFTTPLFNKDRPSDNQKMMAMDLFFGDVEISSPEMKEMTISRRLTSDFSPSSQTLTTNQTQEGYEIFQVVMRPVIGREETFLDLLRGCLQDEEWFLQYFAASKLRMDLNTSADEDPDFVTSAIIDMFDWISSTRFDEDESSTKDLIYQYIWKPINQPPQNVKASETEDEPTNVETNYIWIEREPTLLPPVPIVQPGAIQQPPKVPQDAIAISSEEDPLMDLLELEEIEPAPFVLRLDEEPPEENEPIPELVEIPPPAPARAKPRPPKAKSVKDTEGAIAGTIYDWFRITITPDTARKKEEFDNEMGRAVYRNPSHFQEKNEYFVKNRRWVWSYLLSKMIKHIEIRCPTLTEPMKYQVFGSATTHWIPGKDQIPRVEIVCTNQEEEIIRAFKTLSKKKEFGWKRFQPGIFWSCLTSFDRYDWKNPETIHSKLYEFARTALVELVEELVNKKTKDNFSVAYTMQQDLTWKRGAMNVAKQIAADPFGTVTFDPMIMDDEEEEAEIRFHWMDWIENQAVLQGEWEAKDTMHYLKDSLIRSMTAPQELRTPFYSRDWMKATNEQKLMGMDLFFRKIILSTIEYDPKTISYRVGSRMLPKFEFEVQNDYEFSVEVHMLPVEAGQEHVLDLIRPSLNDKEFFIEYIYNSRFKGIQRQADRLEKAITALYDYLNEGIFDADTEFTENLQQLEVFITFESAEASDEVHSSYSEDEEFGEVSIIAELTEPVKEKSKKAEIKKTKSKPKAGAKPKAAPNPNPNPNPPIFVQPPGVPPAIFVPPPPPPAPILLPQPIVVPIPPPGVPAPYVVPIEPQQKKQKKGKKKDKGKSKKSKKSKKNKGAPEEMAPGPRMEPIIVEGSIEQTIKTMSQFRGPNARKLKGEMLKTLAGRGSGEWVNAWKHEKLALPALVLDALFEIGVRTQQSSGAMVYKIIPTEPSDIHWPVDSNPSVPLCLGIKLKGTETDLRRGLWLAYRKMTDSKKLSALIDNDEFKKTYWKSRFNLPHLTWMKLVNESNNEADKLSLGIFNFVLSELKYNTLSIPPEGTASFFYLDETKQWKERRQFTGLFFIGKKAVPTVDGKRKANDDGNPDPKHRKANFGTVEDVMRYFDDPSIAADLQSKYETMSAVEWVDAVEPAHGSCFLFDKLVKTASVLVEETKNGIVQRYYQQIPAKASQESWDKKTRFAVPIMMRFELAGTETSNRTKAWRAAKAAVESGLPFFTKPAIEDLVRMYCQKRFDTPSKNFRWEEIPTDMATFYTTFAKKIRTMTRDPPTQSQAVFLKFEKVWKIALTGVVFPNYVNGKFIGLPSPQRDEINEWMFDQKLRSFSAFNLLLQNNGAKLWDLQNADEQLVETPGFKPIYLITYLALSLLKKVAVLSNVIVITVTPQKYSRIEKLEESFSFSFHRLVAARAQGLPFSDPDLFLTTELIWKLMRSGVASELFEIKAKTELTFTFNRDPKTREVFIHIEDQDDDQAKFSEQALSSIVATLPAFSTPSLLHKLIHPSIFTLSILQHPMVVMGSTGRQLLSPSLAQITNLQAAWRDERDMEYLFYLKETNPAVAMLLLMEATVGDMLGTQSRGGNGIFEFQPQTFGQYKTTVVVGDAPSIVVNLNSRWLKFAHGFKIQPPLSFTEFLVLHRGKYSLPFTRLRSAAVVLNALWTQVLNGTSILTEQSVTTLKIVGSAVYIGEETMPIKPLVMIARAEVQQEAATVENPIVYVGHERTQKSEHDFINIENRAGVLLLEHKQFPADFGYPRRQKGVKSNAKVLKQLLDNLIVCTEFWDVSCGNFTVMQRDERISVKGYHRPRKHDDWDLQIKFVIPPDSLERDQLLQMAKTGTLTWSSIGGMLNLPDSITLFTNKKSVQYFVHLICEKNVENIVYIYHQGTGRWAVISPDSPLHQLW